MCLSGDGFLRSAFLMLLRCDIALRIVFYREGEFMRKIYKLILRKVNEVDKTLYLNWILRSFCLMAFQVLWPLLPAAIVYSAEGGGILKVLLIAGGIGVGAAAALFFSTALYQRAWMRIQQIRYFILLDLIGFSLEVPYEKTLDDVFLTDLEKARQATMNPDIGVGAVLVNTYTVLGEILTSLGLIGILSGLSWGFSLFVLVAVAAEFALSRLTTKEDEREWDRISPVRRRYDAVYDCAADERFGKDLRVFPLLGLVKRYGARYARQIRDISNRAREKRLRLQCGINVIQFVFDVVLYGWIVLYIMRGEIGVGSFLTYVLGVTQLAKSVQAILKQRNTTVKEKKRFEPFFTILDATEVGDAYRPKDRASDEREEADIEIEFDHVTFMYPNAEKPVLNDIRLKIHKGERIALVGANGAGKSTMVKLLCRLYSATEGRILLNGRDINEIPLQQYYRLLQVVFQDGMVFPYTVRENVLFGDDFEPLKYEQASRLSGFHHVEERLPKGGDTYLSHIMSSDGTDLSGGEKQKLLLTRALYRQGSMIVLDEPSGAIDALAEEALYRHYEELTSRRTSIIISHQLSFVGFCDRILLLWDGNVAEDGTHQELMSLKGKYYEMYSMQKKQYEEAKTAAME